MAQDTSFLQGPKFTATHRQRVAQHPLHPWQCHQPWWGCSSQCCIWRAAVVQKENLKGTKELTRSEDKMENVQNGHDTSERQTDQDCVLQPLPCHVAPAGIVQGVRTASQPRDKLKGRYHLCLRQQCLTNLCEGPETSQGWDKVVHFHTGRLLPTPGKPTTLRIYNSNINRSSSKSSSWTVRGYLVSCARAVVLSSWAETAARFPRKVPILCSVY